MPSSHGTRRKSRSVLTKSNKVTGVSYLLINYQPGDKVVVNIDPSEHTTMPHRRFQGRVGTIESIGRRHYESNGNVWKQTKVLANQI